MGRRRTIEKIEQSEYVTVGELVRLTGIRYSTLKFYTEEGLLEFQQFEKKLVRRYKRKETIDRINYINYLKEKGNTIANIKALICKK